MSSSHSAIRLGTLLLSINRRKEFKLSNSKVQLGNEPLVTTLPPETSIALRTVVEENRFREDCPALLYESVREVKSVRVFCDTS